VYDQPVDQEFLALARERGVIYTPTLTVFDGYYQVSTRRFSPSYPTECVDPGTLANARATDTIPFQQPPAPDVLERQQRLNADRLRRAQANLAAVFAAGIEVAMGTDAGNPLTLHGPSVFAEMEAMQAAGLLAADVLVASTRGAARAMGADSIMGTVEPGKSADLVVLGADPTTDVRNVRAIRYVMRSGALSIPRLLAPR
jgi:imidazolonepropionase-like amidohydrolase